MSTPTACGCGETNCTVCGPRLAPAASSKARTSLELGLLSLALTLLTGPAAIAWGVLGLRDIRRGRGRVRGKGAALAGIGTGVVGTLLGVWLLAVAVEAVREASDRST